MWRTLFVPNKKRHEVVASQYNYKNCKKKIQAEQNRSSTTRCHLGGEKLNQGSLEERIEKQNMDGEHSVEFRMKEHF